MTTKNTPVKFTKQKMIEDINSLRKMTMEKQYFKSDLGRLYPSLYCYKVVNKLIELGFLKFSEKQAQGSYYKWNFDTRVDLKTVDALFSSVLEYRNFLSKKSLQHRVMRIKKQELIKSQEKATSDLFPEVKEVVMKEIEMPLGFQMFSPDEQARYLGLVPTKEEIQSWKDEIEGLKINLEKKSIYIKELLEEIKRKDDYVYSMSFKHQDDLDQQEKRYKKLLSEKQLEPTFVPKEEDKKPFTPVLAEIKKQEIENKKPTKYLKLFGYMIYEKN
jgi:hypothetical protein